MNKLIRKMQTAAGGPLFPWQLNTEWVNDWKFRTTPASRSRVLSGKGVETDKQYTERRKKETTKRTWRSDAADIAHGIGEGVLALHPYTAIPYFGAKVGLDFLNGTYGWHTALNASVPLFHLAPQAVGLREATNVALEDAANAGSKTARNWRVAREIKLATKNKPKYTKVPSKSLFRTQVYKGGEITDPYSNFVTTDPLYAANYGKVTPYIFESKSVAKAKEPMMGSSDPVTMDMFVYNNTKRNPNATAIIGHDAATGEFTPSKGIEILNMNPKNLYPIRTSDSPTSLAFFERKPSKISEAERLGIPKGDRSNLSLNQRQAIEDLALYRNSGQYRQVFRVMPNWEDFGWSLSRNNPTFMLQFVADRESMRGPWARVVLQTPTGKGVVSWNPEKNMGGYSSRMFKLPLELKYSPGEANMMLDGSNQKIILTSPRVDIQDFMDDLANGTIEDLNLFKSLDSQLKRTIDKDVMKDFWINSRKVQRPGSYMSGDNGKAPLGSTLIEAFKNKRLHKTPILEKPIDLQTIRRTGLSPDSYSSIIRLGNRDGSLRWGEGFTNWNNSAIENKFVSDALRLLKNGEITPEQYEKIFNEWSLGIGGRPLLWTTIQGLKIPVHPHPYIYAKKQGGKMNILEFLKNGNKIKKALLGTNLDVDTRSDTTRQGRHEGTTYFGAANLPNTWGILDWLNELDRLTNKSRSDSPIYNPKLNIGTAPSGSRGDLIWKYLHSFVTKHPQVLKSFPTIGKGFIKGNEMSVGQVVQPLEGLSVRLVRPLNLSNPVNNAAEKAAAEDFMKETGLVVNTKMPTGRPKGDYKYPQKILERTPKVVRKDFLNAKVTQSERYHDNRDFSKRDRTLDKNARAYESKKATPVNSGRSRVHENQNSNDWETLSKYKEYAKRLYKIQERLNKYPKGSNEYKQAFKDRKALIEEYRNKYRFLSGGVLDFLKNGSNIYIKPSKRGSFTKYCNGKVTEECIARGKRSPSAAIRKKATFAANSRKWSKN